MPANEVDAKQNTEQMMMRVNERALPLRFVVVVDESLFVGYID